MIDWLNELDKVLFILINVELSNSITDFIMPIITNDMVLRTAYGLAMLVVLWKGNARLRWMVLFSAIAIAFSDQLVNGLLKEMIARPRPCQTMSAVHLLVGCGAAYSMPSSHAANAFAQAVFFGTLVRKPRKYLAFIAFLIAISRVFVGVHYPGDVLVGSIIGITIGLFVALLFAVFERKVLARALQNRSH